MGDHETLEEGRARVMRARHDTPQDIFVVTTEQGFTESFTEDTITTLLRLGLIKHVVDRYVLETSGGEGVGALHRFYGPAA